MNPSSKLDIAPTYPTYCTLLKTGLQLPTYDSWNEPIYIPFNPPKKSPNKPVFAAVLICFPMVKIGGFGQI